MDNGHLESTQLVFTVCGYRCKLYVARALSSRGASEGTENELLIGTAAVGCVEAAAILTGVVCAGVVVVAFRILNTAVGGFIAFAFAQLAKVHRTWILIVAIGCVLAIVAAARNR